MSNELTVDYRADYDILFAHIGPMCVCENIEVQPGFMVRVSRDTGRATGVEIMDAARRFKIAHPETFAWWAFVYGLLVRHTAEAEAAYQDMVTR